MTALYSMGTDGGTNAAMWTFMCTVLLVVPGQAMFFSAGDGGLFGDLFWGVIDPSDPNQEVGSNLTLNCRIKNAYSGGLNSTFAYWTHKATAELRHQPIPSYVVDSRSTEVHVLRGTEEDSGTYFCFMNESSIGGHPDVALGQTDVVFTKLPRKISSITCISDNYWNMTCDWCDQAENAVIYDLEWAISSTNNGICSRFTDTRRCQCVFCFNTGVLQGGKCEEGDQDLYYPVTYNMTVTAHEVQHVVMAVVSKKPQMRVNGPDINITTSIDIVKFRPPSEVTVVTVNSNSVQVSWTHPQKTDIYGLEYTVTYTSKWDSLRQVTVWNDSIVVLEDLHPYTKYNISITVRVFNDNIYSHMSDPAYTTITTLSAAPNAEPLMVFGGFRSVKGPGKNMRDVTVFWEAIDEADKNGVIERYLIQWYSSEDVIARQNYNISAHVSSYELILESNIAYTVLLEAYVQGSYASPRSELYIPAQVLPQPLLEAEVTSEEAFELRVEVSPNMIVNTYTLLSCRGNVGSTDCSGAVSLEMLVHNSSSSVATYNITYNSGWVYAIAVNSAEGTTGLSPTWLCLYSSAGAVAKPSFMFAEEQAERSISIRWQALTCSQSKPGKIHHYRINIRLQGEPGSYMEIGSPDFTDPQQLTYTAKGLQPYTRYTVEMEACSETNHCSDVYKSNITTQSSAPEDSPSKITATIDNSQVTITWEPPQLPNGYISKYIINFNDSKADQLVHTTYTDGGKDKLEIGTLPGFINYTVEVIAENSAGQSSPSQKTWFYMPIKAPTSVDVKKLSLLDNSSILVEWSPPNPPNGPIDAYIIQWYQNDTRQPYSVTVEGNRQKAAITPKCEDRGTAVSVGVKAVNRKDTVELKSAAGQVELITACITSTENQWKIVGPILAVIFIIAFGVAVWQIRKRCKTDFVFKEPTGADKYVKNIDEQDDIVEGTYVDITEPVTSLEEIPLEEDIDRDSDSGVSSSRSRASSETSQQGARNSSNNLSQDPLPNHGNVADYSRISPSRTANPGPGDILPECHINMASQGSDIMSEHGSSDPQEPDSDFALEASSDGSPHPADTSEGPSTTETSDGELHTTDSSTSDSTGGSIYCQGVPDGVFQAPVTKQETGDDSGEQLAAAGTSSNGSQISQISPYTKATPNEAAATPGLQTCPSSMSDNQPGLSCAPVAGQPSETSGGSIQSADRTTSEGSYIAGTSSAGYCQGVESRDNKFQEPVNSASYYCQGEVECRGFQNQDINGSPMSLKKYVGIDSNC